MAAVSEIAIVELEFLCLPLVTYELPSFTCPNKVTARVIDNNSNKNNTHIY
jgi:hypothetical protein